MHIRQAHPPDLAPVVRILNESAGTGANAILSPVTEASRRAWFGAHSPDAHPLWIAEIEGDVAGWCSLSAWRGGREALRGTAEISYYVARDRQRRGVGTALVRHALAEAAGLGLHTLLAVGLETNAASEALLRREGFTRWGTLPGVARWDGRAVAQWIYGRAV
ncbi:MAG TPA: N-acetyltransferase family protein [Bacteroidetes bacterium]|nr:N-acetyltransferase family protein [Bacteroidota bacterium]HIL56720.1 N-acetyltransferase family protein [Rhodothermales bacterium]